MEDIHEVKICDAWIDHRDNTHSVCSRRAVVEVTSELPGFGVSIVHYCPKHRTRAQAPKPTSITRRTIREVLT